MSEPIEKVAETWGTDAIRGYYIQQLEDLAPSRRTRGESQLLTVLREAVRSLEARDAEVLVLRKLCGVMREAVRLAVIELPLCLHAPIFDAECSRCQAHAALAEYRKHFPAPAVKPEGPKEG